MLELTWGRRHLAALNDSIGFGRTAEMTPALENRHMSRTVGQFEFVAGQWILHNVGSNGSISLVSKSGWRVSVPESSSSALADPGGEIFFFAAAERYRLTWSTDQVLSPPASDLRGKTTITSEITLTETERAVMATFGIPIFSGLSGILSHAEVAHRLGVSRKTVEGHLGRVANKTSFYMYEGSVRDLDSTIDRVHFLIEVGVITVDMAL